jgi:DNA-binding transcriptional ArsR family regulator
MGKKIVKDFVKISELLNALGHPVRLHIIQGLIRHECNVGAMVANLGIPQSTVSQHLAVLKNRGILQIRKEGVRTCYRITDAKVVELMKVFFGK